jgi:hypothetical protein
MTLEFALPQGATMLRRGGEGSTQRVGFLDEHGVIYRLRWSEALPVGRVDLDRRLVFRMTRHDERELGSYTPEGTVRSHGLFEGGELGWVDDEGTVVQAGLIFGEEEVGQVDGPQPIAAGAALLLIFVPDELEAQQRMAKG